jgi:hypothetical protein
MNLEHKIQKQTFRDIPKGRRAEILARCGSIPERVPFHWSELLWPSPVAWASLAMAWLVAATFFFRPGLDARPSNLSADDGSVRTLEAPPLLLAEDESAELLSRFKQFKFQ